MGHNTEEISGYLGIQRLSQYLDIKVSTLYSLVEAKEIPHYRIGRLVRFRKAEIDIWMESNRKGCMDAQESSGSPLRPRTEPLVDADRIVRKAIESARGGRYNPPHGKPDQVRGLGKEVYNGSLSERLGLVDELCLSREAV